MNFVLLIGRSSRRIGRTLHRFGNVSTRIFVRLLLSLRSFRVVFRRLVKKLNRRRDKFDCLAVLARFGLPCFLSKRTSNKNVRTL